MEPHQLSLFVLIPIPIPILSGCLIRWARRRAGPPLPAEAAGQHGGLKKRTLRSIPVELYGADGGAAAADVRAICLGEFADGEKVRVLELYGADGAMAAADVRAICLGEFADGEKVRVLVVA